MSCVVSSYASTLSAQAYATANSVTLGLGEFSLLPVAHAPNAWWIGPYLPGVEREVDSVHDIIRRHMDVKSRKCQPVKVILDDLPLYDGVHFACPGYADPISPFIRSDFLLCGKEPDKGFLRNTKESLLTVDSISSINTKRSQLAFLSACCTAENASLRLMSWNSSCWRFSGCWILSCDRVIVESWRWPLCRDLPSERDNGSGFGDEVVDFVVWCDDIGRDREWDMINGESGSWDIKICSCRGL